MCIVIRRVGFTRHHSFTFCQETTVKQFNPLKLDTLCSFIFYPKTGYIHKNVPYKSITSSTSTTKLFQSELNPKIMCSFG